SSNIITDSRSVLLALENVNNIDEKILALKAKLNNFTGEIHLFWIKAHKGHLGNERADELAKSATNEPIIECFTKIDPQTIKYLINKDISQEWKDRWSHSIKGRDVYHLFQNVTIKRVQGDFYLNQIITGHGSIGAYQARLFDKDPSCMCGHSFEDRVHIIYHCPQWDEIRKRFFPKNYKEIKLELLLANKISRQGIRDLMQTKFQALLQSLEDDEQ
ncbi:RNase H domain-containing protein, partial [Caerostris darwini]